jgi:GDP-fucose protein O-fucosyltransferase
MQMETVTVFAAATARILVLPPDQPMYLLNAGKGHQKAHSFADFFPFDLINQRTPVISMDEFMRREGVTGRLKKLNTEEVLLPPGNKTEFVGTIKDDRLSMWWYLRNVSACPAWKSMKEFCVIPFAPGVNVTLLPDAAAYKERLLRFAAKRSPQYYDDEWQKQKVVHFQSNPGSGFRLLEHFYTCIHFEDPRMDRYYKRFVRDFVHYTDTIFCKAAIIINKLKEEGAGGLYSAFHIRR